MHQSFYEYATVGDTGEGSDALVRVDRIIAKYAKVGWKLHSLHITAHPTDPKIPPCYLIIFERLCEPMNKG